MNDSQSNHTKKKKGKSNTKKKLDYWDSETNTSLTTYPQLGQASFTGFLGKLGLGLLLSFIPSVFFFLLFDYEFYGVWGTAILIISGIYFFAAGWSDLSKTSARKSHKRYMKKIEVTQARDERFKFNLGFFQFGTFQEDIGVAISLLAIAVLISSLSF